jgi:hypothetical protein
MLTRVDKRLNKHRIRKHVLFALLLSGCHGGTDTPPANNPPVTISFDCAAGPSCPEILPAGDPVYTLPNGTPGPYRGLADPSLRKDPNSSRLWMSYSYVGLHVDPDAVITQYVSIHLAHSDDHGATWQHDANLWESTAGTDQGETTDDGYSVHEVSTLAPFSTASATEWFGLHLRYFLKRGDPVELRKGDSFHYRLARESTPAAIGGGTEAILTNPLTAAGWGSDLNLSALAPELSVCDVWSEPALLQDDDQLYLIVECIAMDLTTTTPTRLYDQEFNAVFATEVTADVTAFDWQYLGKITANATDAAALGGNVLTPVDIARARDGKLILIVTPTDESGGSLNHQGCRVLEIASLNPPQLQRNVDGSLRVRADIRSSDSESSGLCAYDPDSDTGIILVRTHIDLEVPEVSWQLHATGIHP